VGAIEVAEASGSAFVREDRIDEERMFRLGHYLRSRVRHIWLPCALPELGRHMEIESFKKQFPESYFNHLDFGGQ
jgi:hypothetical protein